MKIHEYQAKELFKKYGIKVPKSVLCEKREDIETVLRTVSLPCVVKAQVHSGARGKAGGVKLAKTYDEAVQNGLDKIGLKKEEVTIEIVKEPKKTTAKKTTTKTAAKKTTKKASK